MVVGSSISLTATMSWLSYIDPDDIDSMVSYLIVNDILSALLEYKSDNVLG